jgi:hypothetical protein
MHTDVGNSCSNMWQSPCLVPTHLWVKDGLHSWHNVRLISSLTPQHVLQPGQQQVLQGEAEVQASHCMTSRLVIL